MALHAQGEARRRPKSAAESKRADREEQKKRGFARGLASILVIALVFFLGFLVRGNSALMDRLGISDGSVEVNPGMTVSGSTYDGLGARVAEVEGILASESLDTYELPDATNQTLIGLFTSTDDPYLHYYDDSRYSLYLEETSAADSAGIGVLFGEYEGQAYAVDVFEGGPAQAAGVHAGDFVLAIDGDRSQGWTAAEVAKALAREDGETVLVTWRRPVSTESEGGEVFNTNMTCREVSSSNIEAWLDDQVGYIRIRQLTQNSAQLVQDAVGQLSDAGMQALVLDLRDCPGGYLSQAVGIASHFMRSGVVVQIETKEGVSTKSTSGAPLTDAPMVVLANGNTAAAAEVLAAALQESGRASVVGTRTLGKGSVQVVTRLSFGGALRYTAAYYLSPLGHAINGNGIAPDYSVVAGDNEAVDNQLDVAFDTARALIAS